MADLASICIACVSVACPTTSVTRSQGSRLCASGSTFQCGDAVALCQRKSTTLSQQLAEVRSAACIDNNNVQNENEHKETRIDGFISIYTHDIISKNM